MAKQFSEKSRMQSVEEEDEGHAGHSGSHWWLMVLCCLPMIGIILLTFLGILNLN